MPLPVPLRNLVEQLKGLPGVGEKTATRLAFFILRSEADYARGLARAIEQVKDEVRLCRHCLGFSETEVCSICDEPSRTGEILCVVEEPGDILALERAGDYRGRYHVLHGTLAPLDGVGPDQLRVTELVDRIHEGGVREIILATNTTTEGEATALYVARQVKPLGVRVSRIAHGLPVGGDVEYADSVTLSRALEGRREM